MPPPASVIRLETPGERKERIGESNLCEAPMIDTETVTWGTRRKYGLFRIRLGTV